MGEELDRIEGIGAVRGRRGREEERRGEGNGS
jgi:hypothetical protein